MLSEQLYYPNIVPDITPEFVLSLLHWDKVVRIFPKHSLKSDIYQPSLISALEKEGLLENEPLDETDKYNCLELFDKIVASAAGPLGPKKYEAELLVKECNIARRDNYFIFRGKSNGQLSKEYPKLFIEKTDKGGNDIFVCSEETGLTYMTLMAYFLCERRKFKNAITDHANAFPLFIFLKSQLGFSLPKVNSFQPSINPEQYIEKIFYMPLVRFLKPKLNQNIKIIENVISFRKDNGNEKLRINYLRRIEAFLTDLNKCSNDDEAKDIAATHEKVLHNELEMIIAACKTYGIPVRKKVINHSEMNGWAIFGKTWEAATQFVELCHSKSLILLKPLLKLKPGIDFYNRVLMNKDTFYPLLILESLSPTWTQKIYAKIRRLDKVKLW